MKERVRRGGQECEKAANLAVLANEVQVWEDGQAEDRVEVQTLPVIYLIPLSHFSFPLLSLSPPFCLSAPFHLIVYPCHSELNFSPAPSLSRSIIPSPFVYLFSPSFLFLSFPTSPLSLSLSRHLSLPSKQDITLPPNRRRSPPFFSSGEKVKINKTAIFRFMCRGQKKYNHECVERVDEATGRDGRRNSGGKNNDGGEKSSGFASEKINYLINSVRVYLCLCGARRYKAK